MLSWMVELAFNGILKTDLDGMTLSKTIQT